MRSAANILLPLALALCAAAPALAGQRQRPPVDPTYLAECASCHIAYPPRFLPAASWRALMSDLGDHFGSDASVDAAAAATILQYLEANARRRRAADDPTPLRITETRWFRHQHDEIAPAVFRRAAIRSAANCGACHTGAADGDFSEERVAIPRDAGGAGPGQAALGAR